MNYKEMIKKAEEIRALFKEIESEYGEKDTMIDTGNWYFVSKKQDDLIAAMAEELKKTTRC